MRRRRVVAAVVLSASAVVGIGLFVTFGKVKNAVNSVVLPPQIHTFKTVHGGSHLRFIEHRYQAERYATSPDSVGATCAALRIWFEARHELVRDEGSTKTIGSSTRCSYGISYRGVHIVASVFTNSPLTGTVPPAPSYVYLYNEH